MDNLRIRRLAAADRASARKMFAMMAGVFGERHSTISNRYTAGLLRRPEFWAIAALAGGEIVGGLTAHTLPMTRIEAREMMVYDVAVRRDHQRKGIGRLLMTCLLKSAARSGVREVFVAVENRDVHAIRFYAALGGAPSSVMHFSFRFRR
ncbi:MAG TPA: GNAT family N-acetyltransferase [Candidatus Acidoferrales bacterium]|nr:GNAT family N-acetyltransferase [Candidatus Acidoferrales bacterium]